MLWKLFLKLTLRLTWDRGVWLLNRRTKISLLSVMVELDTTVNSIFPSPRCSPLLKMMWGKSMLFSKILLTFIWAVMSFPQLAGTSVPRFKTSWNWRTSRAMGSCRCTGVSSWSRCFQPIVRSFYGEMMHKMSPFLNQTYLITGAPKPMSLRVISKLFSHCWIKQQDHRLSFIYSLPQQGSRKPLAQCHEQVIMSSFIWNPILNFQN